MQLLVEKELLPKLKNVHLDKRAGCLVSKQNRFAFPLRPPIRSKTILKLIHTNICYVDVKSHSGGQYFVTFIDDYNRKLWA